MISETGELITPTVISKGRFKVDVEVGPQYESQREATVESLQKAIEAVGPESPYFAPLMAMWMKNISGTGLDELKEFNRNQMLQMGLAKPENDEEAQMLESLQNQVDPQEELNKSISNQQNAEAKSLEAGAQQKLADAAKKKAETVKIMTEIPQSFMERRMEQING